MEDPLLTLVHLLLANLAGTEHQLHRLHPGLSLNDIPASMGLERDLFATYQALPALNSAPVERNLWTYLAVHFGRTDRAAFERILSARSVYASVEHASQLLYEHTRNDKARQAWEKAYRLVLSAEGTPGMRQQEALAGLLAELAPLTADTSLDLGGESLANFYRDHLLNEWQNGQRGIPPGASTVFLGMTDYLLDGKVVPGQARWFRWGESSLLTAFSGHGKTMLLLHLARINAEKHGHEVLYVSNETDLPTLLRRMESSRTLIPFHTLDHWTATPWDQPAHRLTAERLAFQQYLRTLPNLHFLWATGWNPYMLANAIYLYRLRAQAAGRGLLVILDYFNNLSLEVMPGSTEVIKAGNATRYLRDAVKQQNTLMQRDKGVGLHMLIAAQQSTSDGEGNTTYAFGAGRVIVQLTQLHLELQRDKEAPADLLIPGKTDFFGHPRYWCRKDGFRHTARLIVHKQNNGPSGFDVPLLIEAPFFLIHSGLKEETHAG